MDLEDLKLIAEVCRRAGFAKVAKDRGVDPSAISRAVAGFERDLGLPLFTRTTRKLAPTPACEALIARTASLVAELESAVDSVQTADAGLSGTLRVLSPVSFGLRWLLPLLPRWMAEHPGLKVDLRLSDATLDLVEERIDVAIRLGPLSPSSYVARALLPMRARACASTEYLKRHGRPRSPVDLARHTCLVLDMPAFGDVWQFKDARGKLTSVTVAARVLSSNALALRELALGGVGIVLQADWIVAPDIASGALVDLFPRHEATASYFGNAAWLLRPQARTVPRRTQAFWEFLISHARSC